MIGDIASKLIPTLVMVGSISGGLWYVTELRADLQTAEQNVNVMEQSLNQQQQTITKIQEDQLEIRESRQELNDIVSEQKREIDRLRSRFSESSSGESRDIGNLAVQKPGLVENIINNASDDATRCLEIASGAELTEEELTNADNSECESLIQRSTD